MVTKRKGTYFDGQRHIACLIKRVGSQKTRIVLEDGTNQVVASESVTLMEEVGTTQKDASERLIPTIALERLYRPLRKFTGSPEAKFQALRKLLDDRYGPKGPEFLAELFRRSVRHAEFYANIEETFYPERPPRNTTGYRFAKRLVALLGRGTQIHVGNHILGFVDYEVFPFRTTYSCLESGKPASRTGSGGMDLLLTSTSTDGIVPAIGEVKAATEQVGPTFALVQSLMYAAQIATRNQFLRLRKHYPDVFAKVNSDQPRVDVAIILEVDQRSNKGDLAYALSLANDLENKLSDYLRSVVFVQCSIDRDTIKSEPASPD